MGMVDYQPYRIIKLTPNGKNAAENVIKKHQVLEEFLKIMGVEGNDKKEDACAMEHVLSNQTIENLKRFAEFIKIQPEAKEFIESFRNYQKQHKLPERSLNPLIGKNNENIQ
jgi:DtxR family Mn-dependent transcriptional regulator